MKVKEYNLRLKIRSLVREANSIETVKGVEDKKEYSQVQVLKGYLTHESYLVNKFKSEDGFAEIELLISSFQKAIKNLKDCVKKAKAYNNFSSEEEKEDC